MYQEVPPFESEEPSFCESMSLNPILAVTPEATAYEIPAPKVSDASSVVPAVPRVVLSLPEPDVYPTLKVISPVTYLAPTEVTELSLTSYSVVPPAT